MIDTVTAPTPIEVTTPIRPSEAIRLGCLIAPVQGFNYFIDDDGSVCAMGAMALGFGRAADGWVPFTDRFMAKVWNQVNRANPGWCPVEGCRNPKGGFVPHLNDDHRWSRERIADWLEGLGL